MFSFILPNKKAGRPGAAAGLQPALSFIYITISSVGPPQLPGFAPHCAGGLGRSDYSGPYSASYRLDTSLNWDSFLTMWSLLSTVADLAAARAAHGAADARRCRGVAGPQEHHVRRSGRRAGPRRANADPARAARNTIHHPDSRLPGATAGGGGSGTLGSPRGLNLSCVAPRALHTAPTSMRYCGRG